MDIIPILTAIKRRMSVRNEDGVMVLVFCEKYFIFLPSFAKISKSFQSYEADTISILKFTKWHNTEKNESRLTVLLWTLSDNASYLYHI